MTKKKDLSDMPLTGAVAAWMKEMEWSDEIEIADDRKSSRLAVSMGINDQGHRLFLESNEEAQQFSLYLYSPYNVPPARLPDALRILNNININHHLRGRLACGDTDEANPIQFHWMIDVEGSSLHPIQIQNMLNAATGLFEFFGDALGQIALTKRPVMTIWDEFWAEKRKQADEGQDDSAPDSL